ncbi:flagellar biosynthesis protein FlhA [Erythrobacteraceae bacterium CFH 75059]|uniref:flagellar biosynthesis protein FlhA n=1 Tax=Qipengyuania thermophila TaxID=2509361 RepID=UPI0010218ED5|nr:flagellar biosynthesis protein FlhA [Erythrobacteraceae bacterium CFH 75059]
MLIVLMVLPIPTVMLDVFLVLNMGLSVAVLMAAMNANRPLDFSSFPSVLLFATLLRLALNVASTRIVLVNGHTGSSSAGQVIESFGHFLVGGNFAVGLFVFIILLIINLVVITKGAGRVSEVSARFTLDALPGKQMAIDADIAGGLLSADDARTRREDLATEADFYGAMDGASKFVKGDAVAALLILGVNVLAGFALGVFSHGLSAIEAAQLYVTLAVGDALVAQVPALLLSIAAAIIVTRVNDARDLAGQVAGQFADPRAWLPVALVLGAMGLIPAMPQTIFLPATGGALWLAWALKRRRTTPGTADAADVSTPDADLSAVAVEDVGDHTLVSLEVGVALLGLVAADRGATLVARLAGVRRQLSQELGFVLSRFRVRDNLALPAGQCRILVGGVVAARAQIRPECLLAIDAGEVVPGHEVRGEATRDPSFDCPALWIATGDRDLAIAEGFLVVDPATVIATLLDQVLRRRSSALLGAAEVREVLDHLAQRNPAVLEGVTPDPLSLTACTRLLRNLLDEGITLAHPLPLFSAIAMALQTTQEFDRVVDLVRISMGPALTARLCDPDETLAVIALDAALEQAILGGLRDPATGQPVIAPDCAAAIRRAVEAALLDLGERRAAVIVQPSARRALDLLLRGHSPRCAVLSVAELPRTQPVEVVAVIGAPASTNPQDAVPEPECLAA